MPSESEDELSQDSDFVSWKEGKSTHLLSQFREARLLFSWVFGRRAIIIGYLLTQARPNSR